MPQNYPTEHDTNFYGMMGHDSGMGCAGNLGQPQPFGTYPTATPDQDYDHDADCNHEDFFGDSDTDSEDEKSTTRNNESGKSSASPHPSEPKSKKRCGGAWRPAWVIEKEMKEREEKLAKKNKRTQTNQ